MLLLDGFRWRGGAMEYSRNGLAWRGVVYVFVCICGKTVVVLDALRRAKTERVREVK